MPYLGPPTVAISFNTIYQELFISYDFQMINKTF